MAGMIGKIDSFDESVESWRSYQERLEQYFAANEVGDNKKVPVLLSVIGGKCYTILRDLAAPDVPGTKTYKELVDILKAHYDPKPLQIAERFRFHKRDQREGENVRDFNAAIRKLSQECAFGQTLGSDKYFAGATLRKATLQLKTYSGEKLIPDGMIDVSVALNGQHEILQLFVVKNDGPPLFGRSWMRAIKLDWTMIKSLKEEELNPRGPQGPEATDSDLKSKLQARFPDVFKDELGTLKEIQARIKVRDDANPRFIKARPIPYALKEKVEQELDRLVDEGIIERVEHSEWATPIVPIPKKDGSVRICGDFKVTVNQVLEVDTYPLPKIEDIFSTLAGGKRFSKLDLRNAYLQMEVRPEDRQYLTINTHRGLYRYKRLAFGISSAPAIWQRTMEQVLQNLSGVQCLLDDMIITGKTTDQHVSNIEKVLDRLQEYGLRLHGGKCEFFQEKVEFCGHIIDEEGLHKAPEKIAAIVNAPPPENISQLRAFLGLINYYSRFVKNLADKLHPLTQCLQKDQKWEWSGECEKAFQSVKRAIASEQVLTHYDSSKPVKLATDASPYGLGAVLSHTMDDGSERPIAFASRTLSRAEKNYAQIDKEALGLVWGIKKFHQYIYGRKFTLVTDHQPLVSIFHPQKGIPMTTAARLQRYALFLSGFQYDIVYKSTSHHCNADGLSRLPLPNTEHMEEMDSTCAYMTAQMDTLPVTTRAIQDATRKDPILSQVYVATMNGWTPEDKMLGAYYNRSKELSLHQGCVTWGIRVVIPEKLQSKVLEEIHEGHLGVVKMKALARSFVWWPGIDQDIERLARSCDGCQAQKAQPPSAPVHPWEMPQRPWQRVHMDFAGPFQGSMFLIMVDAYSKWPEVIPMKTTTTIKTIEVCREIFARNGLPQCIVSDNGPQFISDSFKDFLKSNGVRHITSAPYHPRTNGLAERFVRSFKQSLKSAKNQTDSVATKLSKFLMAYRTTPQETTKETPSVLFHGRNLMTRLALLRPSVERNVSRAQEEVIMKSRTPVRAFSVGEPVSVRDYRQDHDKWVPATISEKTGPLSYKVKVTPGVLWRRHTDQISRAESARGNTGVSADHANVCLAPYSTSTSGTDVPEGTPSKQGVGKSTPRAKSDVCKRQETTPTRTLPARFNRGCAPNRLDL